MSQLSRRSVRLTAGALVLALASTSAACGIPTDDQPRAISSSSTASPSSDTSTSMDRDSVNSLEETVYLVEGSSTGSPDGERLTPRTVHVPNTTDTAELVKATLGELIGLPSDEGLTNALPSGTKILDITLSEDGTELTIDLSEEFNDVQQSLQRQAFAQLVFSATGVTPAAISRVRFEIEGEPRAAATGNDVTPGAGEPVSRADYPGFEATMASSTTEIGAG